MQLLTTDASVLNEIAAIAKKKEIQPMRWIDFCSLCNDMWFRGELTDEQSEIIKDWAWKIKGFPDSEEYKRAEQIFGVLKYAYENRELSW